MSKFKVKAHDGEIIEVEADAIAANGPRIYLTGADEAIIAIVDNPFYVVRLDEG